MTTSINQNGAFLCAQAVAREMVKAKRAERVGLELNARVEAGDLPDIAVELIRESRADRVILIRPKSYMLGRLVDEIADAIEDGFDGELVIV